jgi:FAD/FMN-containing dehydrogenase
MNDLVAALRKIVGDTNVILAADEVAPYATDWRGRYAGAPLCVVKPKNTDQVSGVIAACVAADVAVVPQGGNTGLCGGATPIGGEVLISLTRMNRVLAVDPENNSITVEAGCTLQAVQEAAAQHERLFPLSLASEGSATIGGNLSTNAGGVQVLRYGNTRDLTLGIEVVLADGRVWRDMRGLRKDNTGYALKHLFIGAEGTLGVITAATLKLFPQPSGRHVAWVALASASAAITLLARLRDAIGDAVTAFELVSGVALGLVLRHIPDTRSPVADEHAWHALIEVAEYRVGLADALQQALADALSAGVVLDATLASSATQAQTLWRLRENISEAQRIEGVSIKHDVSVPLSRIPSFIDDAERVLRAKFPDLRIVCFGHLGDGNLHYNLSKPNQTSNQEFITQSESATRIVHDLVSSLEGSISAEHGIGQLKRDELINYKSPLELEMMRSIKQTFDPRGLMNPGKVL